MWSAVPSWASAGRPSDASRAPSRVPLLTATAPAAVSPGSRPESTRGWRAEPASERAASVTPTAAETAAAPIAIATSARRRVSARPRGRRLRLGAPLMAGMVARLGSPADRPFGRPRGPVAVAERTTRDAPTPAGEPSRVPWSGAEATAIVPPAASMRTRWDASPTCPSASRSAGSSGGKPLPVVLDHEPSSSPSWTSRTPTRLARACWTTLLSSSRAAEKRSASTRGWRFSYRRSSSSARPARVAVCCATERSAACTPACSSTYGCSSETASAVAPRCPREPGRPARTRDEATPRRPPRARGAPRGGSGARGRGATRRGSCAPAAPPRARRRGGASAPPRAGSLARCAGRAGGRGGHRRGRPRQGNRPASR